MTDSLAAKLNLSISENVLYLLFTNRSDIFKGEIIGIENEAVQLISTFGTWNSFEIFRQMQSLSNSQKQKIKSKENLRDALSGLLVRKKIIELANEKDWFIQPKFSSSTITFRNSWVVASIICSRTPDSPSRFLGPFISLPVDLRPCQPIVRKLN